MDPATKCAREVITHAVEAIDALARGDAARTDDALRRAFVACANARSEIQTGWFLERSHRS